MAFNEGLKSCVTVCVVPENMDHTSPTEYFFFVWTHSSGKNFLNFGKNCV